MQSVRSNHPSSTHGLLVAICLVVAGAVAVRSRADGPEPASPPSPDAIEFFEKHVRPLLENRCIECHSADEASGGLALDSCDGARTGGDSGAAIVPGVSGESLLLEAVRYENRDLQMPPKNRLQPAEIEILAKWIADGAHDPRVARSDVARVEATGMSIEAGREFWSFVPPTRPPLPEVVDAAWPRTPIDRFVLAELESRGLAPAAETDRRTLIRRVTFDLTGVPPTPAEVDAFLKDDSPDAYERVVDRLLASPRYGVRWGRRWLDVARYADSNGLDENLAFGNAWRYRDWVVDAVDDDLPYERFVVEQLAGDLIDDADDSSRTATGFLALGAKVLAEPDREKLTMDSIDEQVDTLGKAFLGMTFGCARCHDHKFDPIRQADYYALAAIFKSTKSFGDTNEGAIKHWYEHPFATTEDQTSELKKTDAEVARRKGAASSFKNQASATLREAARARAAAYLAAAALVPADASLTLIAEVAKPRGLHPRILHHCRLHLEYSAGDPFLARWHELYRSIGTERDAPSAAAAIEGHYGPLFEEAVAAFAAAKAKDAAAAKLDDERLEPARAALHDAAGLLVVPDDPRAAFDAETLAEYDRLMEEARRFESAAPDAPAAMGVTESDVVAELPIHVRGSHLNLGEPVPRGFPVVMLPENQSPSLPSDGSGRLELAEWIAGAENPVAARVYVNRIWRGHFGVGIVGSTENFGALGDAPSHRELLDWLAVDFVESGGSTKALHRSIVTSSVYRASSTRPDEIACVSVDSENRLLWKFRRQRLDAEQMRDSILFVSGRLDEAVGGKAVPLRNRQFVFDHTSIDRTRYDSLRRAIYLPVIRNNLYAMFEQFDFPDPTMPTGSRGETVVAPQALFLLNDDLVIDSAEALADDLIGSREVGPGRVERVYLKTLGREPSAAETTAALAFVERELSEHPDAERRAWALVCQSLFASSQFLYVQ